MRTVVVMAMKATLVDTPQPVDAQLHQLMPGMLDYMQDQDRLVITDSKRFNLCSLSLGRVNCCSDVVLQSQQLP